MARRKSRARIFGVNAKVGMLSRRRLVIALAGAQALALAGCNPSDASPFRSTDITGADFGRDFRLIDHHGRARQLADFRGKAVVMFFGFMQCPAACPTTLAEISAALKRLGADSGRVQVLFVTVDPERDTPELLKQYLNAFDPAFLGLHGSADDIRRTAMEFKIYYRKVTNAGGQDYTIDHSTGCYVFDASGRLRLFVSHEQGADVFAHDLRALLKG
jgi:protein SCO1/2